MGVSSPAVFDKSEEISRGRRVKKERGRQKGLRFDNVRHSNSKWKEGTAKACDEPEG